VYGDCTSEYDGEDKTKYDFYGLLSRPTHKSGDSRGDRIRA